LKENTKIRRFDDYRDRMWEILKVMSLLKEGEK
jgi:hypothetical protein